MSNGLLPGMGSLEQAIGYLGGGLAKPTSGLSEEMKAALGIGQTATADPEKGTPGTSGFPWAIIPVIISLLQTVFKKSPKEEAEDLKSQMGILGLNPPYQSPYASTIDPVVLKALLARLGQTSNWGWPAGKGIDTSFIQEALNNIGTVNPLGTGQTTPNILSTLSRRQLGG
jgi:hypothetical protein